MKSLIQYLKEEGATPGNTMGMGNPVASDPGRAGGELGTTGTEPIEPTAKYLKEKKKKKRSK